MYKKLMPGPKRREQAATVTVAIAAGLIVISALLSIFETFQTDRIPFDSGRADIRLIIQLLTIYFAVQMLRRKLVSWVILVGLLTFWWLHGVLDVVNGHPVQVTAVLVAPVLLALLILERPYFNVKSDMVSMRRGMVVAAGSLVFAIVYGVTGFYLIDERAFGINFTLQHAITETLRQYALFGSNLTPQTFYARWFLVSIAIVGIAALISIVISLFRPIQLRFNQTDDEKAEAERLVRQFPHSNEDFFKIWPRADLHYYFNQSRTCCISYAVRGDIALVLRDPNGPALEAAGLVKSFREYASKNGWRVAAVHVSPAGKAVYEQAGLHSLVIGQEAVIDLSSFSSRISRSKHFRYIENRFQKQGYSFELLEPPIAPEMLETLQSISKSWLSKDRQERNFGLGYFDRQYVQGCRIAFVRDGEGKGVAFANLVPPLISSEATNDLMRFRPDSLGGIMHYLLLELLKRLDDEGVAVFNLGFVPFAGIEDVKRADVPVQLMKFFKSYGGWLFSFSGLEQFKNKFEPEWEDRYLLYQGSQATLVPIVRAIAAAMKPLDEDESVQQSNHQ